MAEIQMFQPGKAFYDAFQQGRGNTLAKLAITGDETQRKGALADLYGLNPEMAQAAQSQIKANDQQDYADLIDSAKVMYSLKGRPEADMMWQRVAPKFSQKYGVQFNPTPQPSDWDAIEKIVQAAGGGDSGFTGAPILIDTPNGPRYARYNAQGITATDYAPADSYKMFSDPKTGEVSGYGSRTNRLVPTAAGGQAQAPSLDAGDPMQPHLDRINSTVQAMKEANMPVEQINAWADNAFAKAQQQVSSTGVTVQQAPQQARVNVKQPEAKGYNRVMTAQEVASAGLPQGTSAQVNEATGAISVLNKPVPTPPKQANADAIKQAAQLPSLLRRVDRVAQASEKLGLLGMDGGPVDQYALGLSESGQELESAVGQLRSMLMPFVRVPGVGSQSDLEARLDGLQYPDASQPPAVRARNIAELQKFIADLSRAYSSTIKGEQGGGQSPVQVRNADDYNQLPSGAQYLDPNGKLRVKK